MKKRRGREYKIKGGQERGREGRTERERKRKEAGEVKKNQLSQRRALTLKRAGDLLSASLLSLLCLLAACMRRLIASNDCRLDFTNASIHL